MPFPLPKDLGILDILRRKFGNTFMKKKKNEKSSEISIRDAPGKHLRIFKFENLIFYM